MRRAIVVALGTGAFISSAAALSLGVTDPQMARTAEAANGPQRTQQSARALQRERIDARYQLDRSRCEGLGGFRRDKCLVQAHAAKGRALLEAAAPYDTRS